MQSPERYLEQIQTLPAPTTRQIAMFASYVSSAHSWYKHLPARKTVPFYVYLDPHGGERFCYESKGRKAFRSNEQPAGRFFHYSEQSTLDYRRRFGYWTTPAILNSHPFMTQWRTGMTRQDSPFASSTQMASNLSFQNKFKR
jgi:hypothetical protein